MSVAAFEPQTRGVVEGWGGAGGRAVELGRTHWLVHTHAGLSQGREEEGLAGPCPLTPNPACGGVSLSNPNLLAQNLLFTIYNMLLPCHHSLANYQSPQSNHRAVGTCGQSTKPVASKPGVSHTETRHSF